MERRDKDLLLLAKESELEIKRTEVEVAGASELASIKNLQAIWKHDAALKGGKVADFFRAMVRPVLSYTSAGILFYVIWGSLPEITDAHLDQFVDMFVFLTTTMVVFWFSDRMVNRK